MRDFLLYTIASIFCCQDFVLVQFYEKPKEGLYQPYHKNHILKNKNLLFVWNTGFTDYLTIITFGNSLLNIFIVFFRQWEDTHNGKEPLLSAQLFTLKLFLNKMKTPLATLSRLITTSSQSTLGQIPDYPTRLWRHTIMKTMLATFHAFHGVIDTPVIWST